MTKRRSVNALVCVCMREDIWWYFLWSSQLVGVRFHNTQVVLYPNTQPTGSGYGPGIFKKRPVRGLGFQQHTRASLSMTHQNPVCHRPMDSVPVGACRQFNYRSIWLPVTWVITRPPSKQDLG